MQRGHSVFIDLHKHDPADGNDDGAGFLVADMTSDGNRGIADFNYFKTKLDDVTEHGWRDKADIVDMPRNQLT